MLASTDMKQKKKEETDRKKKVFELKLATIASKNAATAIKQKSINRASPST